MSRRTALALFVVAALPWNAAWSQIANPRAAAVTAPHSLTDQYCVGCHNQKNPTAGVSLNGIDVAECREQRGTAGKGAAQTPHRRDASRRHARPAAPWRRRSRNPWRTRSIRPPPPSQSRRPAVHRLNRAEYSNAVRDLLALDIQPGAKLPVDDSGYGFDNIGDVLSFLRRCWKGTCRWRAW